MSTLQAITDAEFEQAIAVGTTLVDFWAPWCGPCKALTPVLEELAVEVEGRVQIVKVDIDANPEVAARYGVMSIPALMLFKDGFKVDATFGTRSKPQLKAFIQLS